MQRSTAPSASAALARTRGALGRRENWLQLIRFCLVGASGYVVNLAVYTLLLKFVGVHYLLAATGSFLVAVTSNYTWNRLWTFRGQRGHVAYQGLRFLVVSTIALAANLAILALLVDTLEVGKVLAQAIAIVLVTPWNFVGNKLWSFRRGSRLAVALAALALAGPAAAAPSEPVFDEDGRLVETPFVPAAGRRTADRGAGDRDPLPPRQGRRLARPLSAEAADGRRVQPGCGRVGREGLVGQGGPDRAREGERPHR